VIFFNKQWQLCDRAMDAKGVWSNGCVSGTKLAIEPAPYSQLGFTSTATEGGVNWIFYQGNDKKIVVCHYQANMAFCQTGSGHGVFQSALAGTPLTANWAAQCRVYYQTVGGVHQGYWRNEGSRKWGLGIPPLSPLSHCFLPPLPRSKG
jgi:hypothetical protein